MTISNLISSEVLKVCHFKIGLEFVERNIMFVSPFGQQFQT